MLLFTKIISKCENLFRFRIIPRVIFKMLASVVVNNEKVRYSMWNLYSAFYDRKTSVNSADNQLLQSILNCNEKLSINGEIHCPFEWFAISKLNSSNTNLNGVSYVFRPFSPMPERDGNYWKLQKAFTAMRKYTYFTYLL